MFDSKAIHSYFCELLCFAPTKTEGKKKRYYRCQASRYRKELRSFVEIGSANCVPIIMLLDAEDASIGSNNSSEETLDAFRQAIVTA
jgi:hypothetical protein